MRVDAAIDSITDAGVEVCFRVHGFPMALAITQIILERGPAKKLNVRPPDGFRGAAPDPGYASLEEFQGDYLGDHPNASPERIEKAWATEQRRLKKENAAFHVFDGRLKLKWLGPTRLFIPLDVTQTGTINFVFAYRYRKGLLWIGARSATGVELTLPASR